MTSFHTRLLIDTDTGSDDAIALLLAATDADTEIVAVTTVAGNVAVAGATRNALCTLELAGAGDVPVHVGWDRPLIRAHSSAQHVHGDDGMSGTVLPDPRAEPRAEHAVDAILRLAGQSPPRSLTLVTLGPLTNIAAALMRDPDLLERFDHTWAMAGAPDAQGNVTATAEFNVWADPEAAAIVLRAGRPERLTFVGWDVSRQDGVIGPQERDAIRALDTPLSQFADDINRSVLDWTTEVTGLAGYDLPDPITMAIALDPSMISHAEEAHVSVSLSDDTRGQLIVDRRVTAPGPNVRLIRRADSRRFLDTLLGCLRTSTDTLSNENAAR